MKIKPLRFVYPILNYIEFYTFLFDSISFVADRPTARHRRASKSIRGGQWRIWESFEGKAILVCKQKKMSIVI